jgi:NAD(P)-dependent dehydrogenase (short-subunit alcohol dehydrogenase family)
MKIQDAFDVSRLVTIVTGGASGLGYAYAEAMAANGAVVDLYDINPDTLNDAVETLKSETGANVSGHVVDVTDRAALRAAFDATAKAHGRIDVVFVNAGIGGGPGFLRPDNSRNPERAFEDLPIDQWDRIMGLDLTAAFSTMQNAVRHMKPNGFGRIVVTSSVSAYRIEQHVAAPYTAAKAGVAHLVRQLAIEVAAYGITVNGIAPGPWITNISGGRLKDPEARAPFERLNPMHRLGEDEDVQGVALFFASKASRYVTGVNLVVDGGVLLGSAD